MPKNRPLPSLALDMGEAAARRLDQWRSSLLLLESGSLAGAAERSFIGYELRGAAIVAAMAELEHVLSECLAALSREMNASSTAVMSLKPSLRSLAMHSRLESLATGSDSDAAWAHRLVLTALDTSLEIVRLPLGSVKRPQPPLDGKTIRPAHVQRVWTVLGMIGQPFPAQRCEASLMRLGSLRNDIAHRNIPIEDVFRQPGTSAREVADYLDDVELLILHVVTEFAAYWTQGLYLV